MQNLSENEMQSEIEGGGWISNWVRDAINWYECHASEIADAYARAAADGANLM